MKIDIAEINKHSPYPVTVEENLSLTFQSDRDIRYRISFSENSGTLADGLVGYYLMFAPENRPAPGLRFFDKKVRETIFCVISNFLTFNNQVVIYICDGRDHHASERSRLFHRWYRAAESKFKERYIMKTVCYDRELAFFGGIILSVDNPRKDEYIAALEAQKQLLGEK